MKMKQKLIAGAIALSAMAGFAVPAAHAEVAATVGIANMYYWRGYDLGGGAALTGDINYSSNGFFVGAWTSSGDEALGTEYDLYAGYAGSVGDFTYGLSVVSYNYPSLGGTEKIAPGDYVEVIPTIGYGPVTLTYYDAVAAEVAPLDNKDYSYATLAVEFDKLTIKYGQHMDDGSTTSSHLDITYAYNDNLSFTIGSLIDDGDDPEADDVTFVVGLTLPLGK